MKNNFKIEYRDLEMKVLSSLRDVIIDSNRKSKFASVKAIEVDIEDYIELAIVDEQLTFIDDRGLYYSVFTVSLEDLIDLLNSLQ
jgi:hypothetical protein